MARGSLPYKVECKSTFVFFETIAAFDCEPAAVGYMHDCAASNPQNSYRVTKGKILIAASWVQGAIHARLGA